MRRGLNARLPAELAHLPLLRVRLSSNTHDVIVERREEAQEARVPMLESTASPGACASHCSVPWPWSPFRSVRCRSGGKALPPAPCPGRLGDRRHRRPRPSLIHRASAPRPSIAIARRRPRHSLARPFFRPCIGRPEKGTCWQSGEHRSTATGSEGLTPRNPRGAAHPTRGRYCFLTGL